MNEEKFKVGNFANNLTELVLIKQIKFEYQVKKPIHLFDSDTRDRYEVKVLMHPCDPNKSDRENLDDAFIKACELGADPNKNVRWKFIDGDWDGTSKCYSKKPNGGNRRCVFFVDGKCCFKGKENPFECKMSL